MQVINFPPPLVPDYLLTAEVIQQKHIYDQNAKVRIDYLNQMPYTEAVYIPNNVNSPATTTIYGDKVAFFIWSDPILSILIESRRMAEMYKNYFNLLHSLAVKEKSKS